MKVEELEKLEEVEVSKDVSPQKNKRDISIDLIRIIACLSVIGTHLCLQVLNRCYNRIDWSRLLEKSFFTDGVPLFFMITGFFLVNGRSYLKMWKGTLKKVLLPSFIYVIFAQIFYMFITNKENVLWCIKNAFYNLNLLGIVKSILTGDVEPINSLCAHLWYIFAYVKIIIWVPVLWLVCKEEHTSKLARRIIIGFGVVATVLVDIQRFVTLPIGEIKVFQLVDRELLYVLLGYELFTYKDKIKNNKKICITSLIGFVLINLIRYRLEMFYMVLKNLTDVIGRDSLMEWRYTCLNIFSGICLFMFLYSFEIKNEKLQKIILWISNKTFGIYLIHYMFLAKVDLYKFEKIEKFIFEIAYLVIGLIVTFVASIIVVYALQKISSACKRICVKEKKS